MRYTVTSKETSPFSVSPSSIDEEVLQNVRVILSSRKYENPLARDIGLESDYHGKPLPVAEALLYKDITEVIEMYEPRAEIVGISFAHDTEKGVLIPTVEVEVKNG